jgi:formamidopyrimidine-DNA glycosylase
VPELPEVETVVRIIRPRLVGRKILRARFRIPRQLAPQTPRELSHALRGNLIHCVERRGKFIVIETDAGTLLVHLRMTGRLYVRLESDPGSDYERALFDLDGQKSVLVLHDPRTLGTIRFFPTGASIEPLAMMGWEPLCTRVRTEMLRERLARRTMAIKPLLLDQKLWAGIGNIYASEILWEARIHPLRLAASLKEKELARLIVAVPKILKRALRRGGTTLRNFASPDGIPGAYQKEFRVYGCEDKPCPVCKRPIVKIVQAQRSTYYCKRCQK